ncbi:MAG: DUF1501 domain-containing protein, partial [bacterium]
MYTRRAFLKTGGLAFFAAGFGGSPAFLNRAVHAALQPNQYGKRKILVTIFQRGGMDGLMAVPPMGDALLLQSRPRLGMSAARSAGENAVIDLKCGFGLHPGFASLLPYFKDNRLAIVHGMGSPDKTRSHFDAQDYMESGTPGRKGTRSGWLNRAVGQLGHEGTAFRAVAITKALPRSLYGDEPALAVSDLRHFGVKVPGAAKIAKKAGNTFESLYEATTEELLRGASRKSFEAIDLLSKAKLRSYRPQNGAEYPQGQLGNSLRQIALLVKADVGLEVAFAESGGWDTHVQQGTTNGSFARQSRELAYAMTAFWKDIGKFQDNVVLMTMTEFGRTVRENGSGGTDHGRGSCLFVLGNSVDGGKVHGSVPRLVPEELEDGRDLPVTTDFRAIFAEVAGKHLGIQNDAALFPG